LKTIVLTLTALILLALNPCLADDRDEIWSYNESVVSCRPKVLGRNGTLTITLGENHGKELAVLRESDNRWYFLVVTQPPEEMNSLMTPSEFKKTKH
jgi:hypothetical protein